MKTKVLELFDTYLDTINHDIKCIKELEPNSLRGLEYAERYKGFFQELRDSIDPIEEIEKMQEELKKSPDYMNDKLAGPVREKLLEELKSRLYPLTQK